MSIYDLFASSIVVIFIIIFLSTTSTVNAVSSQDTCVIGGTTYYRGQPLLQEQFRTRCGPTFEYPCYCNPDLDPPIQCPYCTFPIEGNDGLACARDKEEITFVDLDGISQQCSCEVPTDPTLSPVSSCQEVEAELTCTVTGADGSMKSFANGESFGDFLPNRCGNADKFPCFCNVDIPGQIECPFCSYLTESMELICAGDEETVRFVNRNGVDVSCRCEIPVPFLGDTLSTCFEPTDPIAPEPSAAPTEDTAEGTDNGEFPVRPAPSQCPAGSCSFEDIDGMLICAAAGEEVVRFVDPDGKAQICSCQLTFNPLAPPISECIEVVSTSSCTLTLPDGSEAVFDEGEMYTYQDGGGAIQECTCSVPLSDGDGMSSQHGPTASCRVIASPSYGQDPATDNEPENESIVGPDPAEPVCTIRLRDGTTKTYANGESLGDDLPNRCGSDFPCYCNVELDNQVECPYCTHVNRGGELVCSKIGEEVEFTSRTGLDVTCQCDADPDSDTPAKTCVESEQQCPFRHCRFIDVDGNKHCAGDGQTQVFTDPNGNVQSCTCTIPFAISAEPISTCEVIESEAPVCKFTKGGIEHVFEKGESFGDLFPSRCGSTTEFPCFCDPDAVGQMYCPYCNWVNEDDELLCAKDQERFRFFNRNGVDVICTCEIDQLTLRPVSNCFEPTVPEGEPTTFPSAHPTPIFSAAPSMTPTVTASNVPSVVPSPTPSSLPSFVPSGAPSQSPSTSFPSSTTTIYEYFPRVRVNYGRRVCLVMDPMSGTISKEITPGDKLFPDEIDGPCGSMAAWPATCDLNLPFGINFPYCQFEDENGDTVCAKDGEDVIVNDFLGEPQVCSCTVKNPVLGPQSLCVPQETPSAAPSVTPSLLPSATPSLLPSSTPTELETIVETTAEEIPANLRGNSNVPSRPSRFPDLTPEILEYSVYGVYGLLGFLVFVGIWMRCRQIYCVCCHRRRRRHECDTSDSSSTYDSSESSSSSSPSEADSDSDDD